MWVINKKKLQEERECSIYQSSVLDYMVKDVIRKGKIVPVSDDSNGESTSFDDVSLDTLYSLGILEKK